jgi:hypothetical protein
MLSTRRNLGGSAKLANEIAKKRFKQVKFVQYNAETGFKDSGFDAKAPTRFEKTFRGYPAIAKWFIRPPPEEKIPDPPKLDVGYLEQFGTTTVPLELTRTAKDGASEFERFDAPLSLLFAHMTGPDTYGSHLYLAQHAIADLPTGMQDDLPTPEILKHLGKGDIYSSSVWMGRPPTRTPLHRDPNPNLFVQLSGKKVVRLFRSQVGQEMYEQVRAQVGKSGGRASMRGEEMMQGEELEALEAAVWDDKHGGYTETTGLEIELAGGDGLYIPLGWWHAVHGVGTVPSVSVCHFFDPRGRRANNLIGKLVVSLRNEVARRCCIHLRFLKA